MTLKEFESLRVGSKVTNSNSTWNGVVTQGFHDNGTIKVHWVRVSNTNQTLDETYRYGEVENWVRFVSHPVALIGLEELI